MGPHQGLKLSRSFAFQEGLRLGDLLALSETPRLCVNEPKWSLVLLRGRSPFRGAFASDYWTELKRPERSTLGLFQRWHEILRHTLLSNLRRWVASCNLHRNGRENCSRPCSVPDSGDQFTRFCAGRSYYLYTTMIFAGSLQAPMTPFRPTVRTRTQTVVPETNPPRTALPPVK